MQESYYYAKMSKQFVSSKGVENDACWGSYRAGTNFTLRCFFLSVKIFLQSGGGCFYFLSISFPCFSEFISVYEVVKELI